MRTFCTQPVTVTPFPSPDVNGLGFEKAVYDTKITDSCVILLCRVTHTISGSI